MSGELSQIESMSRLEWLAERKTGIGGSDAAAAAGVSKWKTRYELWLDKTSSVTDDEPTEPMRWGSLLEPVIRQRYADVTGNEVLVPSAPVRHAEYDWLVGNVDGVVVGDRIVECKTSRTSDAWGDTDSEEIPDEYMLQVQHYMMATGYELCDVAVLIGGSDFRIYTISANRELQDALFAREAAFWQMVVDRTPPPPETADDVAMAFPSNKLAGLLEVDESAAALHRDLTLLRDSLAEQESERERIETALKKLIGFHDGIQFRGSPLVTWKSSKPSKKFDAKAFVADQPDLAKKYMTEQPGSRRFLLKKVK